MSAPEPAGSIHSSLWRRAPRYAAWQILAVLVGGLALDALFGWAGQIAANVWTVAVFIWLMRSGDRLEKRALLACAIIAAAGEVCCSLLWGLYDYRFHNVPVFVPPGHALLMTLGFLTARRLPGWTVWLVPVAALPYALAGWWQGWDTAGALLFLVFAAFMVCGQAKRLYAAMFVLSLLLEIYGTWLGNWVWRLDVPATGLTTPNPPICAGAFYCALDLLVLGAMGLVTSQRRQADATA